MCEARHLLDFIESIPSEEGRKGFAVSNNHPNRSPRHSHLPGHIRDTFIQAINAFVDSEPGTPLPLVPYEIHYRERLISIAEACRLLWHCNDILPGNTFDALRDCLKSPPETQTYAAAAQALLRELQIAGQVDSPADIARRQLYDALDADWRNLEGWIFDHQRGEDLLETQDEPLLFWRRHEARVG
jgi:hypothetical protein